MSESNSNDPKSVKDAADKNEESNGDDEELDALLDGICLEGFDKPALQVPKSKDDVKAEAAAPKIRCETASGGSGDTEFAESLLKVSQEAAAKVFERQTRSGSIFADTLRYLAEGTESLQTEVDEATLAKMLEKMAFGPDGGFGDSAGGDMGGLGDILPAMQGMLQSLLSKELLYPSIKDIVGKVSDHLRRAESQSCSS
uniref:Peroxin-19 n=1 Tax=Daphnia galeata TaxID=27404 RepID=A0A8J2WVK1_9CRUS|nr:unnamed protein product [Daphnia galeata]